MNVKQQLIDALLTLIAEGVLLEKITIKQLLKKANVSRQTFYNHFLDKDDLIQAVYKQKILGQFNNKTHDFDFYEELVKVFNNIKKYQNFMKQACLLTGPNSLKEYMFEHCQAFDLKWHEVLYGQKMPQELMLTTKYHAIASSSMTLSWILSDLPMEANEMAKLITTMRGVGMQRYFGAKNPYQVDK